MTDPRLDWGRWCVEQRGWSVLLLALDQAGKKVPPHNCERCDPERGYDGHDRESCECLVCHGFYAATRNLERLKWMLKAVPNGYLAVRTGAASGIVVVDAEAPGSHGHVPEDGEVFGTDAIERWEPMIGWELPRTLMSRTVAGGLHLFYALPAVAVVKSGALKVPGVEIKGEGGYVGVPCGQPDRTWVDPQVSLATAPAELLDARSTRSNGGWSYRARTKEEVKPFPPGERWRALVSLAGTMATRPEFDQDAIKAALLVVNRKLCQPEHDEAEIERIARAADATWEPSLPSASDAARLQDAVRRWLK
jgi:hypothetical protein